MRVYFLRHGIAEDAGPGITDAQRQLTPEGIEKTRQSAGQFLGMGVEPSVIYSSPLVRARQTAEIVAEVIGCALEIEAAVGPGFNARALTALAAKHTSGDLMVVGHEPDFSYTVGAVIGGGDVTMRKGGLARVDVIASNPIRGSLVWLIQPRVWEGSRE